MEKEKSKIEVNIMGDLYVTINNKHESYHSGYNSDKYDNDYKLEEERHSRTRDRFYRANAL